MCLQTDEVLQILKYSDEDQWEFYEMYPAENYLEPAEDERLQVKSDINGPQSKGCDIQSINRSDSAILLLVPSAANYR